MMHRYPVCRGTPLRNASTSHNQTLARESTRISAGSVSAVKKPEVRSEFCSPEPIACKTEKDASGSQRSRSFWPLVTAPKLAAESN
jgi:hypothetical protein